MTKHDWSPIGEDLAKVKVHSTSRDKENNLILIDYQIGDERKIHKIPNNSDKKIHMKRFQKMFREKSKEWLRDQIKKREDDA